jgi:hypothetical protein
MHLAREMYKYVTHMETVDIPDEFFDKTSFRYLMHGTAETWRENVLVHALYEKFVEFRFEGAWYRGDSHIYTYGAMKFITNLKNHLTENLECFMIRTAFALNRGISRKGIWSIINGITKDRQHEDDVEFVDKKTSKGSTNEASVTRAAIQEHRAVLRLVNPTEKISKLEKK